MPLDGSDRILVGVVAVIAAYGALFGGAELLRRWEIPGEHTRSLVHALSAILALGLPYLFGSPWPVVVMGIGFAGSMVVSERLGLLGSIHDVPRRTTGAAMFPLGIAAAYALTGGQVPSYPVAVLALGLGDPAAAFTGRRFARRSTTIWGTQRSVEGSIAACVVSAIATFAILLASGASDGSSLIALSVAVGVAVALAEATSPFGFDNVAIPSVAAIVMNIAVAPWRMTVLVAVLAIAAIMGLAWDRSVLMALTRRSRLP